MRFVLIQKRLFSLIKTLTLLSSSHIHVICYIQGVPAILQTCVQVSLALYEYILYMSNCSVHMTVI